MKKLIITAAIAVAFSVPATAQTVLGTGASAWANDALSTAIGAGASSGILSGALGGGAQATGPWSTAVGTQAEATPWSSAVGGYARATGFRSTAVGITSLAAGKASVAVGSNAVAWGDNSVALGSNSIAMRANAVDVGNRQITSVAAPEASTDAANKEYVDNVGQEVARRDAQLNAATRAYVDTSVAALGGQVSQLNNRIDSVDKKSSGGVALALSLQGGVALAPGESAVTAGAGAFGGQGAVGVGIAHNVELSPETLKDSWVKEVVISAGVGASTVGDVGGRAAVSFKF